MSCEVFVITASDSDNESILSFSHLILQVDVMVVKVSQ